MSEEKHFTVELTDDNFNELALKSSLPVVVDFWAKWCGPCVMMGSIIDELAKDYEGKAIVGKVDVDENPQLSTNYNIHSIPTILLMRDGRVIDRLVGSMPKNSLEDRMEALFDKTTEE